WHVNALPDYARFMKECKGARARLRFLIAYHLRSIHDQPVLFKLIVDVRDDENYKSTRIYALNKKYSAALLKVIDEGVASGELRPGLPGKMIRDLIWGSIDYMTRAYVAGRGHFSVDELADWLTDCIFSGIAAQPAREEPLSSVLRRLEAVAERL